MKKLWLLLALVFSLWALPQAAVNAQDTQNFIIKSFTADYYLERTPEKVSTLKVTEVIQAQFPDFDQNHGILRAIPKSYQDHTVSLKIINVKNEAGAPWNYTTYKENDNLVLQIGDADKYVRGLQTYVISYQMRNVINFQPDYQELYWDVNGDQWPQATEKVSATVHIPNTLSSELHDRQVCYGGPSGGTNQDNCSIERITAEGETVISVKGGKLSPYETLTFVLAFNQGAFVQGPEIAKEQLHKKIKLAAITAAILVPPAIAFYIMFSRWRRFGDDPKGRGVIIPEYEPPKGLSALSGDFLMQQKLRNLAFSAAVIELAISGYVKIYETKEKKTLRRDSTDYLLELTKKPDALVHELKTVTETVFEDSTVGKQVSLSQLKKSAKSSTRLYTKMKSLENHLANDLFKKGYFIKDPHKVRSGYLLWSIPLFVAGFFGLFIWPLSVLGVGIILAGLVVAIFAFLMPARTELGVHAHDSLLGLKDYINLAEKDRLKFLQSPEGAEKIASSDINPLEPKSQVKLFEKLLPYAMLFGLEKQWAKQFEDVYKTPPDWYHGNWTAFSAGYLAGSLHGFSAVSSVTFTSPSSSSGSGFSGGSSGGGGGGGGGGGW